MKRRNATRNALFTSIISLMLCVSMLVGTTFAWFTDSVVSGVNTIAAGNLDVELYHGKDQNPVDEVNEGTLLFTDVGGNVIDQWEPGVVAFTNLKVANVGTLALKYQLSINSTEMNYVEYPDGTIYTLADALKVAVVEGGVSGDRAAVIAKGAEAGWNGLKSFTLPGVLEGNTTSETYGIVIYWQPGDNETDNLFNMNNGKTTSDGKPLTITLGVNLFATQEMYEDDSFGPNYDGAASWVTLADTNWYFQNPEATEFTINSAEELAGLAAIVNGTATSDVSTYAAEGEAITVKDDFAGQTVKLASNIDLAGHVWTPIGYNGNSDWNNVFEGTFDGQGYTISNLYINAPEGEGVGLFGVTQNATIKGINVKNVSITGYSMVATIVGSPYTGCTISDCHVTGDINLVAEWAYVGGVVGYGYTKIDNCSVIADGTGVIMSKTRNAVGGISAWLLEDASAITNCQVKNLELTGWANIGAITGFMHRLGVIDSCTAENVVLTKTREDGIATVGLAAGGWSYNASKAITITNNTFKNITLNGTYVANAGADILYGGEYGGATTTNFVLENNTTETITNNLVEVSKVSDGIIVNNGVYQIYNANGLKSLSATRISGNYKLIADIDMGGADFSAMIVNRNDSATFNGNGHTISNVKVVSGADDNTTGQASMFYAYPDSTLNVSDLTLENVTVKADENDTGYAAAVVGYCEGTANLTNVDVVNATIVGVKSSGALVGHLSGSLTATDCDVSGTVTLAENTVEANGHYAGKYLGTMAGAAALNNCTANVTVSGQLHAANDGAIYGRKTAAGSLTLDGNSFVSDGLYTDAAGNYYVYNAAGLQALNQYFKDGAYGHAIWGATFNIMADIDASNTTWDCVRLNTPNNDCVGFTVNGNGHTISGLTINGSGMFSSTTNGKNTNVPATFKNLTFDGASVTGGYHTGIIWGQMYGDIVLENVHVTNSAVTGTCNVGAFVGRNGDEGASTVAYKNCSVTNTVITATGNGDPNGASVFQGSALTITNSVSVTITFENCSQSGNTLTSAEGQVGGGIYACWNASTNETSVVNDFT